MTNRSLGVRRAALLASSVALLGLLAGCGDGDDTASAPPSESGTAAPATTATPSDRGPGSGVPTDAASASRTPSAPPSPPVAPAATPPS